MHLDSDLCKVTRRHNKDTSILETGKKRGDKETNNCIFTVRMQSTEYIVIINTGQNVRIIELYTKKLIS